MPPRRQLTVILAAIGGLGLGWLAGRGETGEHADAGNAASMVKSMRPRNSSAVGSGPRRDFSAYVSRVSRPAEQEEAIVSVERMSGAELRALLLSVPSLAFGRDRTAEDQLKAVAAEAAAAELFRREGLAAVDWSESTGRKETRAALLVALCAADPRAGFERMKSFNLTYGGELGWTFGAASINAAALRGVDDVLEVEKLWDGISAEYVPAFAPGFDFGTYLAKTSASDPGAMMTAWAAADPDAAGKSLATAKGPRLLNSALVGRATMVGDEEAVRWACELAAAIPDSARSQAVRGLARDASDSRAVALIENLPTDQDRLDFFSGLTKSDMSGRSTAPLAALAAMDSEALRVRALMGTVKDAGPSTWEMAEPREHFTGKLERMMDQVGMSAAGRNEVRNGIPPAE